MEGVTNALGFPPCPGRPAGPARGFSWRGARPVVLDSVRRTGRWSRENPADEGNGRARVHRYRAEAVAVGAVNGGTVAVQLGSHEAASRRLVLRWLREQARRIADGLDPDPRTADWAAGGALVPLPELTADVPAELRRWCADEERQRAAADRLAEGLPFLLTAADHTGRYALHAWPVGVAAPHPGTSPLARAR